MENKTVEELKQYCRDKNIQGFSKLNKQELFNFVNEQNNNQINNQKNNKQVDQDAVFAKTLYESEREYYVQKQNAEIQKQKEEFIKQKKLQDVINKKKIYEESLMKKEQDDEYKKAVEEDLKKMEMLKCKEEKDRKYAEKISGDELDRMRLARLTRFN
tara:strand:+ start:16 stop:489 length:474 start_codon:yes stop_codon:yes gene_type:complete